MCSKIVLTGYMGCGKSATAKILSKMINFQWIDLDKFIENKENLTIQEIFNIKGEIYFRKLEIKSLQWIIENENNFVLSLGGGTPCFGENYKILQNIDIQSFYLQTSVNEIVNRLKYSSQSRPMLQNLKPEDMEEFISKHIFERSYYYNFAKFTINTDKKDNQTVVNEILNILNTNENIH